MSPFVMERQVLDNERLIIFYLESQSYGVLQQQKKKNMNHVALITTHHCHVCRKQFQNASSSFNPSAQ